MNYTTNEVLQFVGENDVKFVKLIFCDIFGVQKNISILSSELPRAFESGIPFETSAVRGFMNIEQSDLFLFPDPSTLAILPWRPQQGRVIRFFCDIKHSDGTSFIGDSRNILKESIEKLNQKGYTCKIGTECEFYLFELDEDGQVTMKPQDFACYLDAAPVDKGENVRREICLMLEKMGIVPETSYHERGPGQNEIDFNYSDTLSAADNFITFKNVVKTIATRNGLFASFMPKPIYAESGSGLHINMVPFHNGLNIFKNGQNGGSKEADSFVSGILNRISEITVFLNPLTNSYNRFGEFEAPKYVTWSSQNKTQLISIPSSKDQFGRVELRSSDPSCNPYLAFNLLIMAGIEGIENNLELCSSSNFDTFNVSEDSLESLKILPKSLDLAIDNALSSDFIKNIMPEATINAYLDHKIQEWKRYSFAENKTDFEHKVYFPWI